MDAREVGVIFRAWERRAEKFNPVHPRDPGLVSLFASGRTEWTGVQVTDEIALTYSAVFACVKVLAETMASVPLVLYERRDRGRVRATEHPIYRLLHDAPNPEMSASELRETMMGGIGLRGNGLALIERNSDGSARYLWPMRPDRTELIRKSGRLWYVVQIDGGEQRAIKSDDVHHVRGLGSTGLWGYAPVDLARESIGIGLATEEYAGRFYANDGTPGGILKHPGNLSEVAQKRLKESVEQAHQGLEKKHRIMIAEEGMEWQSMGVDPATAQAIEARRFGAEEIARWYRVPLHMIQHLERATFNNIEVLDLGFVKYTILPWITKWEQSVSRSILSAGDVERGLFAEFLLEGILRADTKARSEFYRALWGIGAMNQDEIRERENLNPIEGGLGATYYIPLNMIPAGTEPIASERDALDGDEARHVERRANPRRAAEARRRIAHSFEATFEDAGRRVIRAERRDVMRLADVHLADTRSAADFSIALEEFYQDPSRLDFIRRTMAPAFSSIAQMLAEEARDGLDVDVGEVVLAQMVGLLVGAFAQRHLASSHGQLRDVLARNLDEPKAALAKRFDEWEATRPGKIARRETVEASGIVTREVCRRGGVQRLRWVSFGDTCPFCTSLDGKVVGIESEFARAGEQIDAKDQAPLVVRSRITHPPIHQGCDCQIVAA
jgi:HK97 family phage portal protein